MTYVVQLRSTGAAALTGLTVTDTLGTTNFPATGGTVQLTPLTYQAGTLRYFMNGVLQTAPAVTVLANGIRIEGVTVPAGGVSTLVYTTRVNAFADPSAEGTIENTVTVTGGGLTDAVTAAETLPALAGKKIRVLRRDIEIGADYTSEEPTVSARIVLSLQLFRLVYLAVALGVEFLKWKINSRPEDKPAAATNERKDDNGRE